MIIYFVLIMIVPLLIQWYLMSTYKKYSKVENFSGMTGAEAARKILDEKGLSDVSVEAIGGRLSDHYDPRDKVVRLSEDNFFGSSIAAVSVAIHEVGHAVQDQNDYAPLRIRHALVPVANLGSNLSWLFILVGALLSSQGLLLAGIALFAGAVAFQVITLPVEFNASSTARNFMLDSGIINNNEESGVKKVLNAAALTYVAATVISILELLRFVLMYFNNED